MTRLLSMDQDREKQAIETKLARLRELAHEFTSSPTDEHIRELEVELDARLKSLDSNPPR
jgi:hypothetical protein